MANSLKNAHPFSFKAALVQALPVFLVASTASCPEAKASTANGRTITSKQILSQSFQPYLPAQPHKWLPTQDSSSKFMPGEPVDSSVDSQVRRADSPTNNPDPQIGAPNDQSFVVNPDGIPALNIIAPSDRPPIPPPPVTPIVAPINQIPSSPSQSWRVKAFQLFKSTKLDSNTQLAFTLDTTPNQAATGLRQAAEEEGLTVQLAMPSGHMLITYAENSSSRIEKAIVTMRAKMSSDQIQGSSSSDSQSASNSRLGSMIDDNMAASRNQTEVRVQCDSRNRTLTLTRMREILNRLQAGLGDPKTRSETL